MINKIKEKLAELGDNIQYGICKKREDSWDCILIKKARLSKSGTSGMDYKYVVSVKIIREDEIPEGTEKEVIDAMKEIGWKMTDDAKYEYVIDANEIVVEICNMEFARSVKRVC